MERVSGDPRFIDDIEDLTRGKQHHTACCFVPRSQSHATLQLDGRGILRQPEPSVYYVAWLYRYQTRMWLLIAVKYSGGRRKWIAGHRADPKLKLKQTAASRVDKQPAMRPRTKLGRISRAEVHHVYKPKLYALRS